MRVGYLNETHQPVAAHDPFSMRSRADSLALDQQFVDTVIDRPNSRTFENWPQLSTELRLGNRPTINRSSDHPFRHTSSLTRGQGHRRGDQDDADAAPQQFFHLRVHPVDLT